MYLLRRSDDRGLTQISWLHSQHTFSFGDYQDPRHTAFSVLRVINEDRVAAAGGFDTHGHRDMEIVSIVLSGELEHRDSMGNATVIGPGEVQRMSAGTGVTHSEHNRSSKDPVHFLQIWIVPQSKGLTPSYDQKSFLGAFKNNVKLVKVASGQPSATAVLIHQDLNLWMGQLFRGDVIQNPVPKNRKTWIQVTRGGLELPQANMVLSAGDGLAIDGEREGLEIHGASSEEAEFLVFDLP